MLFEEKHNHDRWRGMSKEVEEKPPGMRPPTLMADLKVAGSEAVDARKGPSGGE